MELAVLYNILIQCRNPIWILIDKIKIIYGPFSRVKFQKVLDTDLRELSMAILVKALLDITKKVIKTGKASNYSQISKTLG